MDSNTKQRMLLVASLCVLLILTIVMIGNRKNITRKMNNKASVVSVEETVEETVDSPIYSGKLFFDGQQVGDDLTAWKKDPFFFADITGTNSEDVSGGDASGNDLSGNDVSGNSISGNDISGNSVSGNEANADKAVSGSDTSKNKAEEEDGQIKREQPDN